MKAMRLPSGEKDGEVALPIFAMSGDGALEVVVRSGGGGEGGEREGSGGEKKSAHGGRV